MISVFLSCPVRPPPGSTETKEGNLELALTYYKELSLALPGCAFIMPWWINCKVFPETEEMVALGMRRNKHWIKRCDELWWCGPRVGDGMREEGDFALSLTGSVIRKTVRRTVRRGALLAAMVTDHQPGEGDYIDIPLGTESRLWLHSP